MYTEKQKVNAFALYMSLQNRFLLELTSNLLQGCKFNQLLPEVIDALWILLQGPGLLFANLLNHRMHLSYSPEGFNTRLG